MICDGYNEYAEVDGDAFVYRPFTRHDRRAIAQQLLALPERVAEKLEKQLVETRIVCAEWDCRIDDMPDESYLRVLELVLGVGRDEQEVQDETNLADGVYLETRYPWLARTSCKSCRQWWWNPLTGELSRQDGEALKRPEDQQLLCEAGRCPKGHRDNPIELSTKNRMAFEHFKTCSALPDDPIVNRNAKIIRDAIDRSRADEAVSGRQRGRSAAARSTDAAGFTGRHAGRGGSDRSFGAVFSLAGGV